MLIRREEILEELAHQQALHNALRKRLRALELQKAQHGNSTPPQIVTEIASLTEEIRECQGEIRELRNFIGEEDEIILTELKYKQELFNTWSLRLIRSRPLLRDITNLEIQRRRLGLTVEHARQLETETRTKLVEEIFYNIDCRRLYWLARAFGFNDDPSKIIDDIPETIRSHLDEGIMSFIKYKDTNISEQLEYIGIGIRLDSNRTLELLLSMIPKNIPLNIDVFEFLTNKINKTWIFQEDKELFAQFFSELRNHLNNT